MLIEVSEGLNKPYVDTHGRIWVKTGADKRQVTAREEMQRIFQQSGLLHADEQAVSAANLENIDQAEFTKYFERRYGKPITATGMPLERLLPNLNLICNGHPNLACMLLFGSEPHHYLPAFIVKAVALPGTVLHDNLIDVISKNPGLRAPALAKLMGLTPKKVEHWIRQLREDHRIEFIGSPKTGGYRCL